MRSTVRQQLAVVSMELAVMIEAAISLAARVALASVPPTIRETAPGVGTSRQQVVSSPLDPIATTQAAELIDDLRSRLLVVVVAHSMRQVARISQRTAFFHLGHLVEYRETGQTFTNPKDPRTQSYITGRIG